MPKYAALLRGISPLNPNMRNDKLRSVFAGLGFTNVKTVISSGNVLFETDRIDVAEMQYAIEEAIMGQLGFHSTTIIRSQSELQAIADAQPFGTLAHARTTYLIVTFLKQAAKTTEMPSWARGKDYKITAIFPREICTVVNAEATKTPDIMAKLEKNYSKEITTRTYKTLERMLKVFAK